ncbi:MAG: LuxR C-terminal-related transcriptional regulator [Pseudomonadales bacterium]|nr:LuxR C-terminal-related transcriptional regulator [Pseudomonadales bacterium]
MNEKHPHPNDIELQKLQLNENSFVLVNKLQPNDKADSWVYRKDLVSLLNKGCSRKITLVLAPAGAGKTTLLTQWYHHFAKSQNVAWLSVDVEDNSFMRFYGYLIASIRKCVPTFGAYLLNKIVEDVEYSVTAQCDLLLQSLNQLQDPLYLVIDDFQWITNKPVLEGFIYILKNIPANVHLVLASRKHPDLPLSQFKMQDQLLAIDENDLRFHVDQITELCQKIHGSTPLDDNRKNIFEATEGWVAGIKLALLSFEELEKRPVWDSASHTFHREIIDYFASSVLNQLDASTKELLTKSSILEKFNSDCLNDIVGVSEAHRTIEALIRSHLFIQPVETSDPTSQWYRFHGLFKEFLFEQLKTIYPNEIAKLHIRAAHWMLENGYWNHAMQHANQSYDDDVKLETFSICCYEWLKSGEFGNLLHWAHQLNDELIFKKMDVAASFITCLLFSRRFNQAQYYMDEFRSAFSSFEDKAHYVELNAYVKILDSLLDLLQNNMQNHSGDCEYIDIRNKTYRALKAFQISIDAYYLLQHTRLDDARKQAGTAKRELMNLGQAYLAGYSDLILIKLDRLEGKKIEARNRTELAYSLTKKHRYSPIWLNAATALAVVRYEENRLQDAENYLVDILPLLSSSGTTEIIMASYCTMARIKSIQNNYKEAMSLLDYLQSVLEVGPYEYFLSAVCMERMRIAVHHGRIDVANQIASEFHLEEKLKKKVWQIKASYDFSWDNLGMSTAYWLFANNDFSGALRILQTISSAALSEKAYSRYTVSQSFVMVCLQHLEKPGQAELVFMETLERVGIVNFNRSTFDEAPGFGGLFGEMVERQNRIQLPSMYIEMFSELYQSDVGYSERFIVQPLTDRELTLLRLLREGMSNKEISRQCDIALSTTKWHVKNIFQKLGVTNRTEAVVQGERLSILE